MSLSDPIGPETPAPLTTVSGNDDSDAVGAAVVVVVGQVGRDLVLNISDYPDAGGSASVIHRIEAAGGKGANQARAFRQLGVPSRLLGVVGDDPVGDAVLRELEGAAVDTRHVVRRATTALLVDVVDQKAHRRLFEDVPGHSLLTVGDLLAATEAGAFRGADTVCLQSQQPAAALACAAQIASDLGLRVVVDGAPAEGSRDHLFTRADVVRADAAEAELIAGRALRSLDETREVANGILDCGPRLVVLSFDGLGEVVAWPGGSEVIPFGDDPVVDPTGGGDAFVAGLVTGLRQGLGPSEAAQLGSRAAAATLGKLGGRPDLTSLHTDIRRSRTPEWP